MSTSSLIQALQNPAFYPHPVSKIEIRETHISWIVLTGEYAYKIKKPVNLGFLDFSTLARRQQDCIQELTLNRRFAPTLYLDVLSIHGTPEQPTWQADTPAIEYVIKLRQFDEKQQWDQLLSRGELSLQHIEQLADKLAEIHQNCPIASAELQGTAHVRQEFFDNFQYLPAVTPLQQWAEQQWHKLEPHMQLRAQQGNVRELHGDLHLGNIVQFQQQVMLFDCLEFDAQLRNIDVINDIAFVMMDLLQHQQTELAYRLLNRYLMRTGDYAGLKLLPFFLVYRALVRAKVAAIQSKHADMTRYITLAQRFTESPRPMILLTCGLSGSGKTWLSQQLQHYLPLIHLRSDVERKRLFGLASEQRGEQNMYQQPINEQVYHSLLLQAEQVIQAGYNVIVDATFLQYKQRQLFTELAKKYTCPCTILYLSVPVAQLQQRIQTRQQQAQDASDATLTVLAQQQLQPFAVDEPVIQLGADLNVADVFHHLPI